MTDAELIASYIRQHGVTMCPPACAAECSATISPEAVTILTAHERKLEADWRRRHPNPGSRYKGKGPCRERNLAAIRAWNQRHNVAAE